MMPACKRLIADRRGITAVEFALIAPVMALMLMGFFDLGHRSYSRSILQGAIQQAARNSTLESGLTSSSAIDQYVKDHVNPVIGGAGTFAFDRKSYSDFSSVGKPEPYTDSNNNKKYDVGECYQDINGNSQWDADLGKAGQGGADDAVLYTVTVTYRRLFPMAKLMGWPTNQVITASTVLRNQPYGDQKIPSAKCKP